MAAQAPGQPAQEERQTVREHSHATVTKGYSAVSFVPTDQMQTSVSVTEDQVVIDTIIPPSRYLPPTLSAAKLAAQMQTDLLQELERLRLGQGSQVASIAHPRSEAAEAEQVWWRSPQPALLGVSPEEVNRARALGIRSLRGEPYLTYFPDPEPAPPAQVNGAVTTCPCVCCRLGCPGADPETHRLPILEDALAPEERGDEVATTGDGNAMLHSELAALQIRTDDGQPLLPELGAVTNEAGASTYRSLSPEGANFSRVTRVQPSSRPPVVPNSKSMPHVRHTPATQRAPAQNDLVPESKPWPFRMPPYPGTARSRPQSSLFSEPPQLGRPSYSTVSRRRPDDPNTPTRERQASGPSISPSLQEVWQNSPKHGSPRHGSPTAQAETLWTPSVPDDLSAQRVEPPRPPPKERKAQPAARAPAPAPAPALAPALRASRAERSASSVQPRSVEAGAGPTGKARPIQGAATAAPSGSTVAAPAPQQQGNSLVTVRRVLQRREPTTTPVVARPAATIPLTPARRDGSPNSGTRIRIVSGDSPLLRSGPLPYTPA